MSSQIFKSGTLIGVNTRAAENAESKKDFNYKFKNYINNQKRQLIHFQIDKFSNHNYVR